jgi:hypothetical protein
MTSSYNISSSIPTYPFPFKRVAKQNSILFNLPQIPIDDELTIKQPSNKSASQSQTSNVIISFTQKVTTPPLRSHRVATPQSTTHSSNITNMLTQIEKQYKHLCEVIVRGYYADHSQFLTLISSENDKQKNKEVFFLEIDRMHDAMNRYCFYQLYDSWFKLKVNPSTNLQPMYIESITDILYKKRHIDLSQSESDNSSYHKIMSICVYKSIHDTFISIPYSDKIEYRASGTLFFWKSAKGKYCVLDFEMYGLQYFQKVIVPWMIENIEYSYYCQNDSDKTTFAQCNPIPFMLPFYFEIKGTNDSENKYSLTIPRNNRKYTMKLANLFMNYMFTGYTNGNENLTLFVTTISSEQMNAKYNLLFNTQHMNINHDCINELRQKNDPGYATT